MVDRDDARLQISCSTPELHRHAQQRRAKHTKSATPVATPVYIDGGTSSSPDGARKLSRRQLAMGPHRALISDYIARNPGTETQGFVAAVRKLAARCRWFNFDFDGTRRESATSLRALRAARTSLKAALTTRGLPDLAVSWDVYEALERSIHTLARRLHDARLARLQRVA